MVFLITAASRVAFSCSDTALGSVVVLELAYHGKRPNAGSAHYYLVKQSPVPGRVEPPRVDILSFTLQPQMGTRGVYSRCV
jgi:hypothetical protein